jgi:hypothetical protein
MYLRPTTSHIPGITSLCTICRTFSSSFGSVSGKVMVERAELMVYIRVKMVMEGLLLNVGMDSSNT